MAGSLRAFCFQRHMLELTVVSFCGQVAKGNDLFHFDISPGHSFLSSKVNSCLSLSSTSVL